jgi:hypothetical protein
MFIRAFYAAFLALPVLVAASILPRDQPVCPAGSTLLCCIPHSGLGGLEGISLSQDDRRQQCRLTELNFF